MNPVGTSEKDSRSETNREEPSQMNLLDTDVVIELLRQKRYEEGSMNLPTFSRGERVKSERKVN